MNEKARWICDECGYDKFRTWDMTAVGFVDAFVFGCPSCGYALRRDDPLGQIEADLLPAVNLRETPDE